MINIGVITIEGKQGKREIYITPFLFHGEKPFKFKPGKFKKLYLYDDLRDEEYYANMPVEVSKMLSMLRVDEPNDTSNRKMSFEKTVVYYGQSFEPYFLGVFDINFDKKTYSNWKGSQREFTEEDLKLIVDQLLLEKREPDYRTIMQLTLPSDINVKRGKVKHKSF